MPQKHFATPFVLPVAAFAATILAGALLLWLEPLSSGKPVAFIDAFFTATSSVCVTGLATVDPSTVFNSAGHGVMLVLMQLGGLGTVTYSTLIFYMVSRRVSLRDRLAVGQALLHDRSFHLGKFLQRIVLLAFTIEAIGALLLFLMAPERISLFKAVFLSVSAFCNAGFALWPDNLMQWRDHLGVNLVVSGLIICGGLGFFVVDEIVRVIGGHLRHKRFSPARAPAFQEPRAQRGQSYNSRIVIGTSIFLLVAGTLVIWLSNIGNPLWKDSSLYDRLMTAFFQSVTCRTAGFSTGDMSAFSDPSLLFMIMLMIIGGSPGSCAGGIKTTTFRVLAGYFVSQFKGRPQVVVKGRAVEFKTLNKALMLFSFSILTVGLGTFLLVLIENGAAQHGESRFHPLFLFFETASAFGTVGLSVNVTPRLSEAGKLLVCLLMFIGRLGPIWLITTIQQFQSEPAYRYPESVMPIG